MKLQTMVCWIVFLSSCIQSNTGFAETTSPVGKSAIPYVATRNDAVRDMLWIADTGKEDVVYDLGSGDGRILIAAVRDFGARRAVGVDIDPERIREGRENAQKAGVANRVEFMQGDLFMADFREATVVTVFLGHSPNIRLRPLLFRSLKPGARVVSHQFAMGEWEPDKALTVRTAYLGMWGEVANPFTDNQYVPDYTGNESHFGSSDKVTMWVVPAPVAGIWRGTIETTSGLQQWEVTLHQRLSKLSGTFLVSGETSASGYIHAEMWGDNVRFECIPEKVPYPLHRTMRFDGYADGDTIRGKAALGRGEAERSIKLKREKTDLTGRWEWSAFPRSRTVGLNISKDDNRLIATFLDGSKSIPVSDFYDFGGGFYFTLLIGRGEQGIVITEDTGWLIGEGVVDRDRSLKGSVEFYPWDRRTSDTVSREWTPSLVRK